MKVLLISEVYLPTVSGVASSTDSIARFLLSKGHEVTLVCPRYKNMDAALVPEGLTMVFAPSVPDPFFVGKPLTPFPFGLFAILRLLKRQRFDIVHIQEPSSLGITALILSKIFHIPTVGAMHFSLEQIGLMGPRILYPLTKRITSMYIRLVYPFYSGIMVPTETFVSALKKIIGSTKDIRAVSNGVDTTVFIPVEAKNINRLRKKWSIPEDKIVFTYIGRLDKDKNLETTIRALTHASLRSHLVIAGVGKYAELLKVYAKKIQVDGRMTWIRRLSVHEMIEVYQASDCFVITSPVETQSIVTLQALSCALPVLAANEGALPELVINDVNGFLVPAYDDKELARRMDELSSVELRKTMGVKSRETSLLHHKPTALLKLEKFYTEVIGGKPYVSVRL